MSDWQTGDREAGPAADLAGPPIAATPSGSWPQEGNVAVGVLCGTVLSMPLWVGLFGALRALLG